jgi:hypothetical protein
MGVTITQGDYIYYTDQTTGDPVSWSWQFQGGTPSTSTLQNPVVQYTSNSSGYNTALTASNFGGLTRSITKYGIITVNPVAISVSLSISNTTPTLSTNVTYNVSGSSNILYYNYYLPSVGNIGPTSATSITVNSSSWLDITTTSDSGAIYTTQNTVAAVTGVGPYGSFANDTGYVTYTKKGFQEDFNYLDPPGGTSAGNPYGDQTQYYVGSVVNSVYTSTVGMAGNGLILKIAQPSLPYSINNQSARVQGELLTYKTPSMDVFSTLGGRMGEIEGQIVASQNAFSYIPGVTGSSVWNSASRYTTGNYMYPNDIGNVFDGSFYFADVNSDLKSLYGSPRWWSSQMIEDVINDTAYASLSSRSLELSSFSSVPAATFLGLTGGYSGGALAGAALPSSDYVRGTRGPDIILYFDIYASANGNLNISTVVDTVTIMISASGGQGNSPDKTLISTNDTIYGPGIASIINNALSSASNSANGYKWDNYIIAQSKQWYAWKQGYVVGRGGTVDATQFEGLKISIKEALWTSGMGGIITKIVISDNSMTWGPFGSPQYPSVLTFGIPSSSNPWLAFNSDTIINPALYNDNAGQQRGWYFKD